MAASSSSAQTSEPIGRRDALDHHFESPSLCSQPTSLGANPEAVLGAELRLSLPFNTGTSVTSLQLHIELPISIPAGKCQFYMNCLDRSCKQLSASATWDQCQCFFPTQPPTEQTYGETHKSLRAHCFVSLGVFRFTAYWLQGALLAICGARVGVSTTSFPRGHPISPPHHTLNPL